MSRRRWQVVALLSVGMIVAQIHRADLSVAISPMADEFGWDAATRGVALSAFYWTYAALLIPVGLLLDRYGIRAAYAVGLVVWSLASCATGLTTGLGMLVALRLAVGAGEAVVTPASMRYIRSHFGEEQRGLAVGIFISGTKIGPAISFPLAAYAISAWGWRGMFAAFGLVGLVWLLPWFAWVERDRDAVVAAADEPRRPLGDLAADRSLWGIVLGAFCYMYFVGFASTWMPAYMQQKHGMTLTQASWYSGIAFFGMAVVSIASGWWADRLIAAGRDALTVRRTFVIAGLSLASMPALAIFTGSLPIMLTTSIVGLSALGLTTSNYWALTHTLMPAGNIATVVGVQNTGGHIATIIAPYITGVLLQWSGAFDAPILAVGFWLCVGVFAYGVLVRRREDTDDVGR
jgi:ACS family D-galactonate transporter-like MFS transporter